MTPDLQKFIAASEADRRDIFFTAAARLGTPVQNIEKDFWVCWTLDVLFNGVFNERKPRFLFKGGTSLSKGYGLISRFSEDIDITIFREDIDQPASLDELEALRGTKRKARLDTIKEACEVYIGGSLLENLSRIVHQTLQDAGISLERGRIELDDQDHQSLRFYYPTVETSISSAYVLPSVKIESGAKSALDPHENVVATPYIAGDLPDFHLQVPDITTVVPERTFWDKVIILHGQRSWFEKRGKLQNDGQRVSRHYYDVYKLIESDAGKRAIVNADLGRDCVRHARMFFNRPDHDLEHAVSGTLKIYPTDAMKEILSRDYENMSEMIFGEAPRFDDVLKAISSLEKRLNSAI